MLKNRILKVKSSLLLVVDFGQMTSFISHMLVVDFHLLVVDFGQMTSPWFLTCKMGHMPF